MAVSFKFPRFKNLDATECCSGLHGFEPFFRRQETVGKLV
jgi:hypothetical protein